MMRINLIVVVTVLALFWPFYLQADDVILPTTKICQVTGEEDRQPPGNPTGSVLGGETGGVTGTDLGFPFEYNRKLYFLFGDSREFPPDRCEPAWCGTENEPIDVLQPNPEQVQRWRSNIEWNTWERVRGEGSDSMATAPLAFDPKHCIPLKFEAVGNDGVFVHQVVGNTIGVPFQLGGPKVAANPQDKWVLVMSNRILVVTDDGRVFVHEVAGNTIGIPFQLASPKVAANPQDKWLLAMDNRLLVITGIPISRWNHSYPFLAVAPLSWVGLKDSWRYFAGLQENGQPDWQENEALAQPLPPSDPLQDGTGYHQCLGYFSVRFIAGWRKWAMMYTCNNNAAEGYNRDNGERGIYLRTAATPWGPWSIPQRIFNPDQAYCYFMHDQRGDESDYCSGKGINPAEESVRDTSTRVTKRAWGGEYAPILLPSQYAKVGPDQTVLYFLMATWNPYQVMLMRTEVMPNP